ncbi:hypothetical protein QTP88_030062 [Uroleucon formosanum]
MNRCGPPSGFPLTSSWPGIVHHLSGTNVCAKGAPPDGRSRPGGDAPGLRTSATLNAVLFNFPSRYLSTIGLVAVFSLRWSLPPASGCTLKQPDSKARSDPGTL